MPTPISPERRKVTQWRRTSIHLTLALSSFATRTSCSADRASTTWGMPKKPIMIGMNGMPPNSSGLPKVRR